MELLEDLAQIIRMIEKVDLRWDSACLTKTLLWFRQEWILEADYSSRINKNQKYKNEVIKI